MALYALYYLELYRSVIRTFTVKTELFKTCGAEPVYVEVDSYFASQRKLLQCDILAFLEGEIYNPTLFDEYSARGFWYM